MRHQVAIIIPVARPVFSSSEQLSLAMLERHLGRYPKYLIHPRGMTLDWQIFSTIKVSQRYFGSAKRHNLMLYQPGFWKLFRDYEFVLMYHLDSLVFSDQLADWCAYGYDFIGAPFISCSDSPWVKKERVGNGGFALYKTRSVIRILQMRHRKHPFRFVEDKMERIPQMVKSCMLPFRISISKSLPDQSALRLRQFIRRLDRVESLELGNDGFWADHASAYDSSFRVAPVSEGLKFAFEVAPRECLKRNNGEIPFGCHAWERYDRQFWVDILKKQGMLEHGIS